MVAYLVEQEAVIRPRMEFMAPKTPTELARSALKRIIELGLAPTPENFGRLYRDAGDTTTDPAPQAGIDPSVSVLQRFDALVCKAASTTAQLATGLARHDEAISISLEDLLAVKQPEETTGAAREVASLVRDIWVTVRASQAELVETRQSLDEIKAELSESRRLSNQDPLTGTDNRRSMEAIITREIARSRRDGEPLAVVMVDIDHFKQVNDSRGHAAGDAALVHLTRLAKALLRGNDAFIRYGGEEFLMVLPETGMQGGLAAGQRLQNVLRRQPLVYEGTAISITISGGVTTLRAEDTGESMVRRADNALYEAKRTGRDCVLSS